MRKITRIRNRRPLLEAASSLSTLSRPAYTVTSRLKGSIEERSQHDSCIEVAFDHFARGAAVREPRRQLERIVRKIKLPPLTESSSREIDRFAADFLDGRLRHSVFSPHDAGTATDEERLSQSAYILLHDLATDRLEPSDPYFWSAWQNVQSQLERLVPLSNNGIQLGH